MVIHTIIPIDSFFKLNELKCHLLGGAKGGELSYFNSRSF